MTTLALVLLSPLVAAMLILLLRRRSAALAVAGVSLALVAALFTLTEVAGGVAEPLLLSGLPDMPLRLAASPLTASLSVMVAVISTLVTIYGVGYMREDPEQPRFFATLMVFIAAMQLLVLSADWISLLAAWELMGLCSYLLIGFWFRRPGVASAATRAFIYTRTADLGLYVAVFVLVGDQGTTEIANTLGATGTPALVAGLALLLAAIGKSAQVPLYDWLQRAMAGPTPVSALLHSATLVAAGAILLIRSAPMLPPGALLAIGLVGGLTALVTGLIALAETDLKRLLAASTSSQYGLMLLAVGAGFPEAALLHLLAHAAIKSSLFTAAGVFQHSRHSTDLDTLAGIGRQHPRVFAGFTLAALSLAGIPPLAGFFSKDSVIAAAVEAPGAAWLLPLALVGTVLTGAYMARALHALWRGPPTAPKVSDPALRWMGAGLGGLVTLSAVLALVFSPLESLLDVHRPESALAVGLGLGAAVTGLSLGWTVSPRHLLGPLLPLARKGFEVAGGLDGLVLRPTLALAAACDRVDGWLDAAALGAGSTALAFSRAALRGDSALYRAALFVGRLNLAAGGVARRTDEQGIDRMIFGLVDSIVDLGERARSLQSGLIHRELALAAAGVGLLGGAITAALWAS